MRGAAESGFPAASVNRNSYSRFQADHLIRTPSVQGVKTDAPMETLKRSFDLVLL